MLVDSKGVFTCSILASIVTILGKYCGNTYEYWPNTWKMCSPASVILANIVTILLSFEAILMMFSVRINFKSQFQSNDLLQALKNVKIALWQYSQILYLQVNTFFKYWVNTCEYYHNTILSSIVTILVSIEQVNTPQVLR